MVFTNALFCNLPPDLINKGLSGQLYRAVKGWIETPTPDGGFERHIETYIQQKNANGIEVEDLMQDDEEVEKIKNYLQQLTSPLSCFEQNFKL